MSQPTPAAPGSLFGLPGYTQPFEQPDQLTDVSQPLSLTNQVPFAPPTSLQQTDIVRWWEIQIVIDWTTTVTDATLSVEAPYNLLQNLVLQMQGQYKPLQVESGFDAWFFQSYRPMRGGSAALSLTGSNAQTGYSNSTIPQASQTTTGIATNPAASSAWAWKIEAPGGLYVDQYWDLALNGTLQPNANGVISPQGAFVSPQYMAGGNRVVTPKWNYAALTAPDQDSGPLVGSVAGAATAVANVRRVGYYSANNPAELPPIWNWQYTRLSTRIPVGGQTKPVLSLSGDDKGQLLSVWCKIFDPESGDYYDVADMSEVAVMYGSSLTRFDDTIQAMQNRFQDQHGFLPPVGHVAWDMLANTSSLGGLSNDQRVLNTLTNANTRVQLTLASAPSASAYAVLGTELLVPVATS